MGAVAVPLSLMSPGTGEAGASSFTSRQGRRNVAAHVGRDAETVGTVELGHRRLAAFATLGVEVRDSIGKARAMQPRDAAEFALAIGAAAGGDDERGPARAHASSSLAAA